MTKEKNRFAGFENFIQAESTALEAVKPEKAIAKSKDPNFKKTTLYLSKVTHLKLRTHTLTTEQDMSELVEQLLTDYLNQLDS